MTKHKTRNGGSLCHCEEHSDEAISGATRLPRTLRVLATTDGKEHRFGIQAFGFHLTFGLCHLDFLSGNSPESTRQGE
jgi:hypothetical protein